MWQSKKGRTSFVKSFLHHEDPAGAGGPKGAKNSPKGFPNKSSKGIPSKGQKAKAAELVKSFFDASSLEEESVSLQVLGI